MPPTTTINQWCMDLLIYGTVREVWADQEDGTAQIDSTFFTTSSSASSGVFWYWGWSNLKK